MSCIYNIKEELEKVAFRTSEQGDPSEFFCKSHKYRLTKAELQRKQCKEKGCRHLTHWKYMKHRYRKKIRGVKK